MKKKKKNIAVHQNAALLVFVEKMTRGRHASGKSSSVPNLSVMLFPTVGQHPEIRTLSFAISHTRLAALPWGPRPAVERRRRELHQR